MANKIKKKSENITTFVLIHILQVINMQAKSADILKGFCFLKRNKFSTLLFPSCVAIQNENEANTVLFVLAVRGKQHCDMFSL